GRPPPPTTGTLGPHPGDPNRQWHGTGAPTSAPPTYTYKLTTADTGKKITVTVTGSKTGYITASKTSTASTPITAAPLALTTTPRSEERRAGEEGNTLSAPART